MRLAEEACRRNLAAASRAFLATTGTDLRPHLVPVTFALTGDSLVIAVDHKPKSTPRLRRLRNIAENPRVAVLCDRYADNWSQLWWVRADGTARVEPDGEPWVQRLAAKYPQYAAAPPPGPFIVITIDHWSGWASGTS
jgi:PPOX class probable F420-dependent enzyme